MMRSVPSWPDRWSIATGRDAFEVVTSGSRGWAQHYAAKGAKFIRIGNLDHDSISLDLQSIQHVDPPAGAEGQRTRLQPDDLLISITAELGMVAVVPPDLGEAYINQHIALARPRAGLESRFLAWYFASEADGKRMLKESGRGGTKVGLGLDDIRNTPIPVPSGQEQLRIADKLDTVLTRVDAVNTHLARVAPLLKRFRQSVRAAATSGRLTEGWRIGHQFTAPRSATLGDMIKISSGDGLTAKEMNSDGGIPVYGGNGVNGFHNEANVFEPTIVIGRVGYYCGSVHLTPASAWVTDNALRVRFDQAVLDRGFLYYALLGTDLRSNMSSTAQPVISGQKIYPIGINIPSAAEQTEIVRRVEILFAFADRLEARLQTAKTATKRLTPALLAKAFRGELVPQDPNDEPASELLQRLAAQVPTVPSKGRRAKVSASAAC